MHGQFRREMSTNADHRLTWKWLTRRDLKAPTEALLCAAQEQALRKNYLKFHIDKSSNRLSIWFLGVTYDRQLTFALHAANVGRKMRRLASALR